LTNIAVAALLHRIASIRAAITSGATQCPTGSH